MELMPLSKTTFSDVMILHHQVFADHRGDFSRLFCRDSLAASGLSAAIAQINFTRTEKQGTVRGLHFQQEPHGERKIITCLRGSIFDVIVDVRANSPTRWQYQVFELNGSGGISLMVPAGFAHGFQALSDDVEMLYLHDQPYNASAQTGLRYNDPRLNIQWPLKVSAISEKDANFALINDTQGAR